MIAPIELGRTDTENLQARISHLVSVVDARLECETDVILSLGLMRAKQALKRQSKSDIKWLCKWIDKIV